MTADFLSMSIRQTSCQFASKFTGGGRLSSYDTEFAQRMADLVRFRNTSVHDCAVVDSQGVYNILCTELHDLRCMARLLTQELNLRLLPARMRHHNLLVVSPLTLMPSLAIARGCEPALCSVDDDLQRAKSHAVTGAQWERSVRW